MENNQLPQKFEEAGWQIPKVFLSDEEYSKALSALILVCVDVLFYNSANKTVFLARRKAKPMDGLWLIGGRRWVGETPTDAIVRKCKSEVGLTLSPERFHYLTTVEYIWKERQQEPQDIGTHGIAYTFGIELSPEELESAAKKLDPNEYETGFGLKEFTRDELVSNNTHPALLYFYDIILK